jgi:hypothetical protein
MKIASARKPPRNNRVRGIEVFAWIFCIKIPMGKKSG